jgi:hypothetical protein
LQFGKAAIKVGKLNPVSDTVLCQTNRKKNPVNHSPNTFPSRICLFIAVVFGCCAVLTLSSCSKKASAAIIGQWRAQGSKEIVEFRKDGTVINPQNEKQNGTYTFTDGSHMNMQLNTGNTNLPEMSATCEVHIQGDKMDMTVTIPGQLQQQKEHFTRLK